MKSIRLVTAKCVCGMGHPGLLGCYSERWREVGYKLSEAAIEFSETGKRESLDFWTEQYKLLKKQIGSHWCNTVLGVDKIKTFNTYRGLKR
jgi:hypothetical protein